MALSESSERADYLQYCISVLGVDVLFRAAEQALEVPLADTCGAEAVAAAPAAIHAVLIDAGFERSSSSAFAELAARLEAAVADEWVRRRDTRDVRRLNSVWSNSLAFDPSHASTRSQPHPQLYVVFGDLEDNLGMQVSSAGISRQSMSVRNDVSVLFLPKLSELLNSPPLKRKAWQDLQATLEIIATSWI